MRGFLTLTLDPVLLTHATPFRRRDTEAPATPSASVTRFGLSNYDGFGSCIHVGYETYCQCGLYMIFHIATNFLFHPFLSLPFIPCMVLFSQLL